MAKVRLTKNELKKQKDALKRYVQYLPTLQLKKQQLQTEILKLRHEEEKLKKERAYLKATIFKWVELFAENVGFEKKIKSREIETEEGNVAGIDIPVFKRVVFNVEEYDLLMTPLWVDEGLRAAEDTITMNARMEILRKQDELLREELRITTQRVNLFEKVMIPQSKENIKKIQIYLGDMQTAAVVTGKIAKEKIQKKNEAAVTV